MTQRDHVPENAANALRQWGQVVRAHDAVRTPTAGCAVA